MNKDSFQLLEHYMLDCMGDSAHDKDHIYRVLYNALDIAATEQDVDYDVLICACLLHDISRKEQFQNPKLCHALVGGDKAYQFLIDNQFNSLFAEKVKHCIQTHRYRQNDPPQSLEAKILFDADKLDATGALGIARTLFYKGTVGEPLYSLLPDGRVSDGTDDEKPSFFQEYRYKLEKLYDRFYTARGNEIAKERQQTAVSFFNNMLREVSDSYDRGLSLLEKQLSNTELWDAYDENFNLIEGVSLKRGEKIDDGVYHLVCDIIVRHTDGDYLIMQRDARKHYGGMWEATAGGSALAGESPLQCAARELFEETGIYADTLTEVGRVVDTECHSAYVEYLCITDCDKDSVKLQEGETSDHRWVDRETLLNMKKDELITERMELFIDELKGKTDDTSEVL